MAQTNIEWATHVWNPTSGCTPISPGCDNCYARRMATRLRGRCGYPEDNPFRVKLYPEKLEEPLRWKKPRRVFVNSMGDLFHEDVRELFILEIFAVMAECPQHTFLVLTKRPERMREVLTSPTVANDVWLMTQTGLDDTKPQWPLPNVWLGVSAENQQTADERIPILLQIPSVVHFVSVEPMLGPINVFSYLEPKNIREQHNDGSIGLKLRPSVKWIIAGGETGPNARPCHPDWVRSLRDQCQASGTPFFFKSWGEYCAPSQMPEQTYRESVIENGTDACWNSDDPTPWRVGKKKAGRLLDGREWNEVPEGVFSCKATAAGTAGK